MPLLKIEKFKALGHLFKLMWYPKTIKQSISLSIKRIISNLSYPILTLKSWRKG